jgi:hypothetical protein
VARPGPSLTVPSRYNGPPDSGNGGYVAGRVAAVLLAALGRAPVGPGSPWVEITLRLPPPLDVELSSVLDHETAALTVSAAQAVVAEARVLDAPPEVATPVQPVPLEQARAAHSRYGGLQAHPFPTCWVCGPQRPVGDGYHLRPGAVDADRTACVWTVDDSATEPDGTVAAAAVWAALDCPGAWTALVDGRPIVLGRMAAHVLDIPVAGEQCVVMGQRLASEGRKTFTLTSVYGQDGRGLGHAAATWIAVALTPG